MRESNIQLQNVVLETRALSFPVSVMSEIVSNAKWKSTKGLRCVQTEWAAVDMASSRYSACLLVYLWNCGFISNIRSKTVS